MRILNVSLTSLLFASTRAFLTPQSVAFKSTTTTHLFQSSPQPPQSTMPYTDEKKMAFYALGTDFARQLGGSLTLLSLEELDIVLEAFSQQFRGKSPYDARSILETYGPQLNAILQERTAGLAEHLNKMGEEYIKDFLQSQVGSMRLPSGLVYCERVEGKGAIPTLEDTVEVHYQMMLPDGMIVDSSVERGETAKFPLNGVIKGWAEGLQQMKEGGKATLVIPADLAYGAQGAGDAIPPGATLTFEVELIKVMETPPPPAQMQETMDMSETELVELPDGTKMRVPKGVKVRLVDPEE